MNLTKCHLKQLIREEIENVLKEDAEGPKYTDPRRCGYQDRPDAWYDGLFRYAPKFQEGAFKVSCDEGCRSLGKLTGKAYQQELACHQSKQIVQYVPKTPEEKARIAAEFEGKVDWETWQKSQKPPTPLDDESGYEKKYDKHYQTSQEKRS